MTRDAGGRFLVSGELPRKADLLDRAVAAVGGSIEFASRRGHPAPKFDPGEYAGLVVLGDDSDHRAYEKVPEFERERGWVRSALGSRLPLLGICYGAHLLGVVQNDGRRGKRGGLVYLRKRGRYVQHRGVVEVVVTPDGGSDPVISPLRQSPWATMSHWDSLQRPPIGATLLVCSDGRSVPDHCEAFCIGEPSDAVYGLQFHPEPTLEQLQSDGWFETPEPIDRLQAVVESGERILRAWVGLAVARQRG